MSTYVALPRVQQPRAWTSDDMHYQERPSVTVIEEDKSPVFTGLVDANGTRIYRLPDVVRVGFHR